MLHYLKQFIVSIIAFIGAVLTVNEFADKYIYSISKSENISIIFIGFFSIYYFSWSLYYQMVWGRKKKYGEILSIVNDGFVEIHDLKRQNSVQKQDIINTCIKVCDSLKEAFTIITGSSCSACIKLLIRDDNRLRVETLCRDNSSYKKRKQDENIRHWIELNTDFWSILVKFGNPKPEYYIANKLPFLFDYSNTSFQVVGQPTKNILLRNFRWPLPYKSTIVVPICPCKVELVKKENIIGFLCIDSPSMFVFRTNYDVDLMLGVADGLFNTIKLLKEKL